MTKRVDRKNKVDNIKLWPNTEILAGCPKLWQLDKNHTFHSFIHVNSFDPLQPWSPVVQWKIINLNKVWLLPSCIQVLPHCPSHKWVVVRGSLVIGLDWPWISVFSTSEYRWMSGWVRDTEKQIGRDRVGTDLFLLNSSRFNQQIIDLIKWHPLLGQEPARGMRISQAKIKICSHAHKDKNLSHTFHKLHQTHPTLHCLLAGCGTSKSTGMDHHEAEAIPHSLPSHQKQKYRQRWKDKTKELSYSAKHSVERADKRRQKLPNQSKPSLHTTNSCFLQ